MADDDQEWVRRTLEGDVTAFDHLVEKYMTRAYKIALRMIHDPQDAEEITQEAFFKAYRALKGFRAEATFYTWFYRILVHLCQDHLRKKRFRSRFLTYFQGEKEEQRQRSIETDVADIHWSSNPNTVIEQAEINGAIQKALTELPARQKTIFVLRHFQDLRIREIAKILKISEGTVKAHLFRAVQSLKKSLVGV